LRPPPSPLRKPSLSGGRSVLLPVNGFQRNQALPGHEHPALRRYPVASSASAPTGSIGTPLTASRPHLARSISLSASHGRREGPTRPGPPILLRCLPPPQKKALVHPLLLVTQKKSTSLLPSSNPESHSLTHVALAAPVDSNPRRLGSAREGSRAVSPPNLAPIPRSRCSVVVWIQELLAFLFLDLSLPQWRRWWSCFLAPRRRRWTGTPRPTRRTGTSPCSHSSSPSSLPSGSSWTGSYSR
jgi:hypothetical protein